jgi:hypothetical protein
MEEALVPAINGQISPDGDLLPNGRSLRTKASELLNKCLRIQFHVFCLSEIWLNNSCFNHNLFPETYFVIQLLVSVTRNHVEVPSLRYLIVYPALFVELT